ncbi:microsomal glutathione S-transferase 1, partial [Asbolus verrucosus]
MQNTTNSMSSEAILTLKNPIFCVYLICSCLLVIKMMIVSLLTIYKRLVHKAYLSPEDADFNKGQVAVHTAVERIRRAHLNDLENIPIFWTAGFAYLWTKPNIILAFTMYFGFTIVRIFHTIIYTILVVPQPSRAILFFSGFLITGY